MSSQPTRSLLSSTVFQRTVVAAIVGTLAIVALLWALYGLNTIKVRRTSLQELQHLSEEMQSLYDEEGLAALTEALSLEDEVIWSEEALYDLLEEDETLWHLLGFDGSTLAGYGGLDAEAGQSDGFIDHDELYDHPVYMHQRHLDEQFVLVAARFLPGELIHQSSQLTTLSVLLILIALPLALGIGYFLSASVYQRLRAIAQTAQNIGESSLQARIPISKKLDEFDHVSQSVNSMLDRIDVLTQNLHGVSVGVAHDIKTPVANISGRLQLIERDIHEPELARRHIEAAHQHIETLQRTLDALLRLGEVESGKRRSAFSILDISSLIVDVCDSFEPIMVDANKTLTTAIEPSVTLQGDAELLTQLLWNLLENVIEHTRDGAHAEVVLKRKDRSMTLLVRDDGPGISPKERTQVWGRFFRSDASRGSPGNGLGLSLVKAIAQLHGGQVVVDANDKGTDFVVTLPTQQD